MKKYGLIILVAALLSWVLLRPILASGLWYPMHDSTHPVRIVLMQWTITGGQFPPVWADTINGGYGYPLFHFYAPLYHLFTALVGYEIPLPTSALKITLFLTLVVGLSGVMLFARRWGRGAMLVATTAFALSPFIALEIYVRGAYSELLSLCLLPWVLLATEHLITKRRIALGSVALALFVLSHNLIPILALPMILVWMLYHNRLGLRQVVWTIILAVALSAWFTLPLVFERHFTRADEIAQTTDYALHFVEPWQLWNSTWGFGGSAQGVEDGMSFKLGKLQIFLGLLGLLFALVTKRFPLILMGGFFALSVYLATPSAKFVWDALPLLQLVQFPWRSLGLVVVFLSLLSGFAVSRVSNKLLRFLLTILIVSGFWRLGSQYFLPQEIITSPLDSEQFSSDEMPDITKVIPEYMPIWWQAGKIADDQTTLPLAYYPTHKGYVDGQEIKLSPNESGLTSFDSKYKSSDIAINYSHTNLEYFAYALTLLAIGYTIGLIKERA